MSYPMRRYEPAFEETDFERPAGPVLVEDEPAPVTDPAGARVPPGRVPPGVFGADLEPIPSPFRRPELPLPRPDRPVGRYVSFLPITVAAVHLILMLIVILGFVVAGMTGQ